MNNQDDKCTYKCSNHFMLRTPLFSINEMESLLDKNITPDSVINFCRNNKIFKEALLINSKDTYNLLTKKILSTKQKKLLAKTLIKYFIRMCTRSTPYGINAGISQGKLTDKTNIILNKNATYQKHITADFEWICKIIKSIEMDVKERKFLKVKVSPIIFSKGDRLYNPYLSIYSENNLMNYNVISIKLTKVVSQVLQYCSDFVLISDLEHFLKSMYNPIDNSKIEALINTLLSKEFLYTNLRPSISNQDDPLKYIYSTCHESGMKTPLLDKIKCIMDFIYEYEKHELGEGIDLYQKLICVMEQTIRSNSYLNINLTKPTLVNNIDKKILKNLEECITLLMALSEPAEDLDIKKLENFFIEKYGYYVDMPLLDFFHENYEKISKNYIYDSNSDKTNYLKKLLSFHLQKNEHQISLTENEIKKLISEFSNKNSQIGSHSFDIFIEILKKENNQYDFFINESGTINAGQIFGRFFKFMDVELLNEISSTSFPKYSDFIYAEINDYPSISRLGNVTLNQNNLHYSISFSAFNSSKSEFPASDLYIGIDKISKHFYIKSKKLNKYIIIKKVNALNDQYSSDISRFLYRISGLNQRNLYQILSKLKFNDSIYTPRVCFKNIILKPATWYIEERDIRFFSGREYWDDKCLMDFFKIYNIPNSFYLQDYDRKLIINMSNPILKDILINTLQKKKNIIIVELLHSSKTILVKDSFKKDYLSEIVFSVYPTSWPDNPISKFDYLKENIIKNYLIGEEGWVYLKLYYCIGRVDDLIGFYIKSFTDKLNKNGILKRHFFVRYKDSDFHIRLRLNFFKDVPFNQINDWIKILIKDGLIKKVIYEPYEQEINRYGGINLISNAEDVFHNDSIAMENILSSRDITSNVSDDFIGIINILNLLKSFSMNRIEQLEYLNGRVQTKGYLSEFRKQRLEIMRISNMNSYLFNFEENKILHFFEKREDSIRVYFRSVLNEKKYCNNANNILDIVSSIIHMSCNRFKADLKWEQKILTLARHGIYAIIEKEKNRK